MTYEITSGSFNLSNKILSEVVHANLDMVGGMDYTEEEHLFAETLMNTFNSEGLSAEVAASVAPFPISKITGNYSTDSGDLSWIVPFFKYVCSNLAPSTPGHSWQTVAAGGTSMDIKGMTVAAKTMAMTAIDLFENPAIIEKTNCNYIKGEVLNLNMSP